MIRDLPAASKCQVTEELIMPFTQGLDGVPTKNSYSGRLIITVKGSGQSAGTARSDAFYLFSDGDGSYTLPKHPDDWILTINSDLAHNFIPDGQVPQYNDDHIYSFEIEAPQGVLVFGVDDGYAVDNSGEYSILICQP